MAAMSVLYLLKVAQRKLFKHALVGVGYGFGVVTAVMGLALRKHLAPTTGVGASWLLFLAAVMMSGLLAIRLAEKLTRSQMRASGRVQDLLHEQAARRTLEFAHERLRESEERFRLTFEEAPIGMTLVALDGRFARVNHALCEIVGYTVEELERLRFQDITHPEDLDVDLELAEKLARGEIPRYQLEKRYFRKNGTIVTILLSASILRGRDGAPLYYISQIEDITERKKAEQALRFSEARFSGIISISADAIISIGKDQRITLFNNGAEDIFGYARSEVLGAPLEMLIPERFREAHRRHVAALASGPVGARRMGNRLTAIAGLRKSGAEFPAEAAISKLEVDGSIILTVALRDITAQKRLEKEQQLLAEAGAALMASLDYERTVATVGQLLVRELADFCLIDIVEERGRPRRMKVVSKDPEKAPLCTQLEGAELERAFLARPVIKTRRPLVLQRVTNEDLALFGEGEGPLQLLRTLDIHSLMALPLLLRGEILGALVFVSSTPSRVYGAADLHFAESLAERIALTIDNGRLYQRSVQATQLRDEVLGVVAHDLRNPLNVILLQSTALQRPEKDPGHFVQSPREVIQRAAKRMNRLIQDLLDVTRIEAGELGIAREPVSTRNLLLESVEAQKPLAASASLTILLEAEERLPAIYGDQHRLLQVFENLVGNAVKFTPPGGCIVVGAAPEKQEMTFWVTDTGCGIPADDLTHVFDRFWQARKGDRSGVGLGLPITRGIVEAHGGRIWVKSAPGHGSTFFFTIPLQIGAPRLSPASQEAG